MSTIHDHRVEPKPGSGSEADPFRCGWRYVVRGHDFGPKKAYYHRAGVPLYVTSSLTPGRVRTVAG